MRITEADMASRGRVMAIESDLVEAIGKHVEKVTYAELLMAIQNVQSRWLQYQLLDEREEENRNPGSRR